MKDYIKFLSKRIFLRKSNIAILCSVLVIIFVVLILNMRTQRLHETLTHEAEALKTDIAKDMEILSSMSEDEETYDQKKSSLETKEVELKTKETMVDLFEKREFTAFYKLYETELEERVQVKLSSIAPDNKNADEFMKMIESDIRQLTYIDYLDGHQLAYEDSEYPIFGLSFMVFVSNYILPILIIICTIYILAQANTLDYAKDIDMSSLFPIGRKKVFLAKLAVGIGTSVFVFLLLTLSSFVFASLMNQNMGLSYPYVTTDIEQNYIAIGFMDQLLKWFSLGMLFFVAVACFIYLLSLWIKEDTALFLTGIIIVLGVAYMPKVIPTLNPITHLLPTTYMNYISVVQGNTAIQYENINITFSQGVLVLSVFIGIAAIVSYAMRMQVFHFKRASKS